MTGKSTWLGGGESTRQRSDGVRCLGALGQNTAGQCLAPHQHHQPSNSYYLTLSHLLRGQTAIWSICMQRAGRQERENSLTVAIDIKSKTITQSRGRYNMQPNKLPSNRKAQLAAQNGYFPVLNRSDFVLREWIGRERLRREG